MSDFLNRFTNPDLIAERIRECVQSVYFPCVVKDWGEMRVRLQRMCWLISKRWPVEAEELFRAIDESKSYCKEVKAAVVKKNEADKARWFGKPPTEKQIEWLRKFNKPVPATASEASRVLDGCFKSV